MTTFELGRRVPDCYRCCGALVFAGAAFADWATRLLDSIHFLIPGGAGGGWDGTARGTGEALTKCRPRWHRRPTRNMSGGGGGKAIGYLIENAESNQHGTLMVNSTPDRDPVADGRVPAQLP